MKAVSKLLGTIEDRAEDVLSVHLSSLFDLSVKQPQLPLGLPVESDDGTTLVEDAEYTQADEEDAFEDKQRGDTVNDGKAGQNKGEAD